MCQLWALHVVTKRQFFYIYLAIAEMRSNDDDDDDDDDNNDNNNNINNNTILIRTL